MQYSIASHLSGTITYSPLVEQIPFLISSIISRGSSYLGLSEVITVKSDNKPEVFPIENLRLLTLFPPAPKRVTNLFGLYSRNDVRILSNPNALCA